MTQEKVLQKIHSLELMIALEIRRICEKNDIHYFLMAGTLLGAVRHGGFIPWDDDMDIGMLRNDYEKFLAACKTDLQDEFFLQTWETDPEFPFSYAKIRLKGTHMIEFFSEKARMQNGLFVDVFPYDSVPEHAAIQRIQAFRLSICKRLLWIKKGMGQNMKETKIKAVKYHLFLLFSKCFRYGAIKDYYDKIQKKYNIKRTQKVVTDSNYSYARESFPREWAEQLEPVLFENEVFLSFKNKTGYLEYYYGNYMELPPVEEREGHSIKKIDFGPYE